MPTGTLLDLRERFIKRSGRFDLVTDFEGGTFTDNGADFFLQAGQRFLDLTQDNPYSRAEYKADLESGEYVKRIPYLRAIEGVHVFKSTLSGRTEVKPKPLGWLKNKYTDQLSTISVGTPIYYTDDVLNLAPGQNDYATIAELEAAVTADTAGFSYDYQNILADNTFENRGILLFPPADGVYTLSVTGVFFSKFIDDDDYTYWSKNFPELTIMDGQMMIEAFYRNSSGVRDWLFAMEPFLKGIDKDEVRREMNYSGNTIQG